MIQQMFSEGEKEEYIWLTNMVLAFLT